MAATPKTEKARTRKHEDKRKAHQAKIDKLKRSAVTPQVSAEIARLQMEYDTMEVDSEENNGENIKPEQDDDDDDISEIPSYELMNKFAPPSNEGPLDLFSLIEKMEIISLSAKGIPNDGSQVHGWISGTFKRHQAILEYGNLEEGSMFRSVEVGEEIKGIYTNLGLNTPGSWRNAKSEYLYKPKIDKVGIESVVWRFELDDPCPILLLRPENWPKDKNGRAKPPFNRTKIVYYEDKINSSSEPLTGWETRQTLHRLFGSNMVKVSTTITLDEHVVLKAGETMRRGDLLMIMAATLRYTKYLEGLRRNQRKPNPVRKSDPGASPPPGQAPPSGQSDPGGPLPPGQAPLSGLPDPVAPPPPEQAPPSGQPDPGGPLPPGQTLPSGQHDTAV